MRRNVKIALLLSCAWMFAFVYYYHTSRDTKVRCTADLGVIPPICTRQYLKRDESFRSNVPLVLARIFRQIAKRQSRTDTWALFKPALKPIRNFNISISNKLTLRTHEISHRLKFRRRCEIASAAALMFRNFYPLILRSANQFERSTRRFWIPDFHQTREWNVEYTCNTMEHALSYLRLRSAYHFRKRCIFMPLGFPSPDHFNTCLNVRHVPSEHACINLSAARQLSYIIIFANQMTSPFEPLTLNTFNTDVAWHGTNHGFQFKKKAEIAGDSKW